MNPQHCLQKDGEDEELHVVEVWQNFKYNSSVFSGYLMKNLPEFFFGLIFLLWLMGVGFRQIINWNTWNVKVMKQLLAP